MLGEARPLLTNDYGTTLAKHKLQEMRKQVL